MMDITQIAPAFDPSTHRLASTYVDTLDPDHDRIVRVYDIAPLTADEIADAKAEIVAKVETTASTLLAAIDAKSVRPLRASIAGTATADDTGKLTTLEAVATAARAYRAAVIASIAAASDLKAARAIDIAGGWPTLP